jgi:hypothetical protein
MVKLKKKIVNKLEKILGFDHSLWINNNLIKNKFEDDVKNNIQLSYLPQISNERFVWLDTNNIEQLLTRYEILYSDYKSFGAVPYDF